MNLYIRYFDEERVVSTIDEALQFISTFQGFVITPSFEQEFREYVTSSMPYPKRYKVRARVYFIVIKTTADTLEEFKANGKGALSADDDEEVNDMSRPFQRIKDQIQLRLNDELPGWYEGTLHFKRVVVVPQTGKFDYMDTTFTARLKAYSAQDCYNRLVDHLRTRVDVDPRSQFPSAKGKNFQYTYLGLKPYSEINV